MYINFIYLTLITIVIYKNYYDVLTLLRPSIKNINKNIYNGIQNHYCSSVKSQILINFLMKIINF